MKVKRYKIKKMVGIAANGLVGDHYSADKYKYEKKITDQKDIDYIQNKNIYPIYFNLAEKYLLLLEVDSLIDHNTTAFFYEPLQSKAKYIIRVDLDDFNSFMEKCGNHFHEKNILFIHHPGRCGSTLLHKILGSHSQVESFSEDLVFNNLFLSENIKSAIFENFFKNIVSYLYKKYIGEENKILSFKMTGSSTIYIDHLLKIIPKSKHIYLTGDPIKISESFANLVTNIRIRNIRIGYILKFVGFFSLKGKLFWERQNIYGYRKDKYLSIGIVSENVRRIRRANFFERTILRVMITDKIFEYYSRDNLVRIRYDDILSREKLFAMLNDFLDLDSNYCFDESVYNSHSQSNSIGKISINKSYKLSKKERKKLISFQKYVTELL